MQKNKNYRPTYPIFFQTVTGNKQYFFLGLSMNGLVSVIRHKKFPVTLPLQVFTQKKSIP